MENDLEWFENLLIVVHLKWLTVGGGVSVLNKKREKELGPNPAIDPIFTQKISLDPYDQNQPHPVLQFLAPPRIFLYQEVGYL